MPVTLAPLSPIFTARFIVAQNPLHAGSAEAEPLGQYMDRGTTTVGVDKRPPVLSAQPSRDPKPSSVTASNRHDQRAIGRGIDPPLVIELNHDLVKIIETVGAVRITTSKLHLFDQPRGGRQTSSSPVRAPANMACHCPVQDVEIAHARMHSQKPLRTVTRRPDR
jgi:hypothetical protein